tara:strand:+ start:10619 stop:10867 length:249 start_codon:yes stop_codon:yes gene_type:complete
MATIIKSDGTRVENYNHEGLKAKQDAVGGYIEPVYTQKWVVLVNEEGLLKNLPLNIEVSQMVGTTIVGDALILTHAEWTAKN